MNPHTEVFQYVCSLSRSLHQATPVQPPLRKEWSVKLDATVTAAVVYGDRIILGCGAYGDVALNTLDGSRVWHRTGKPKRRISSAFWAGPGALMIEDDDYCRWLLDWQTGKATSETARLLGFISGEPVYSNAGVEGPFMRAGSGVKRILPEAIPNPLPGHDYWYGWPQQEPQDLSLIAAWDPRTGEEIWRRKFSSRWSCASITSRWIRLRIENDPDVTWDYAVLDARTGDTVWEASLPLIPDSHRVHNPEADFVNPQLDAVLVVDTARATVEIRDIPSGRTLWEYPYGFAGFGRRSGPMFWTGNILWGWAVKKNITEDQISSRGLSDSQRDTVAFDGLTGRELWRGPYQNCIPYDGRLYSWTGRTVNCWVSADGEEALAETSATGKPAKAKKKSAAKSAGAAGLKGRSYSHLDGPEPQSDWREWELMETEDDGPEPVAVSALLDGLGKVFPNVELLADATIVITDAKDQHWGTLTIAPHHQANRRAKKVTAQSEITGCSIFADPVVDEVLGLLLEKLGVNWEWGN